jgi:multidrug efflux pump subunit AcrB
MVFLPTSMMSGISGLIFRQFGWTIVISVVISLLVARLLTPILAATFLKSDTHKETADGKIMKVYLSAVKSCLAYRRTTMVLATLFFVISVAMSGLLPSGFIPPSDIGFTMVNFEIPPGSTLQNSISTAEMVRKAIADVNGVEHVFATVGDAQATGMGYKQVGEVRKGSIIVKFKPLGTRPSQIVIENTIRKKLVNIPGTRFNISTGGPGEKLSILLSSENAAALNATAKNLEHDLRSKGTLNNIVSDASLERPEIIIRPNAIRAAELGINTQTIGDTVRVATAGDFDTQLSRLNLDNRQVYIRVRLTEGVRQNLDTIAALRIPSNNGQTTLGTIAEISTSTGPSQINRYDRHRYVTVNADLGGTPLGKALHDAEQSSAIKNMPSSVKLLDTGDTEFMGELFNGFAMAMLTGILCVFCILVLLFSNFFQPITILSALPLSIGGVIISLLLAKQQMSLPALIGMVMLMGIVTKNSILLVEYTIVGMRDRGMNRYDALIDACHKRARPIVMTTTAMIAGMLPIALGFGGDASFRQPMAIAVIGGLITSTALSLLVVPVTFTYVHGFENWVYSLFGRKHLREANPVDKSLVSEEENAEKVVA